MAEDLEERLIAAGCLHSQLAHIALLSPKAPGQRWRRIARHFRRQLVHIPMSKFNDANHRTICACPCAQRQRSTIFCILYSKGLKVGC